RVTAMRRPSTCRRPRRISPSSWKKRRAPDDERRVVAGAVRPREHDQEEFMTGFTRRKMLTVAAATAASAVGSANLTTQTGAQTTTRKPGAQPPAAEDAAGALFIALSAALRGIEKKRLSPAVDPIQINRQYFAQAKADPAFDSLMQIIRSDPSNPAAAAVNVMNNADPKIRYLGRSII